MAIARSPILQLPSIGRATSAVLAAVDTAHPHPPRTSPPLTPS